jgi:hypothetical protein
VRIARLRILPIGLGIKHGEQGFALSGGILDSGITPTARGHIMNLDEDLITRLIKLDFGDS